MKDFNVLFTCCGMHVKERIDSLRNNEDGTKVRIYAANCERDNLPPADMADGTYVVPRIYKPEYLPTILHICKSNDIHVIVPTVTLELEFMAKNKKFFEHEGIKVSVASPKALATANNKIKLHEAYGELMPKEITPTSFEEVERFKILLPKGSSLCCKLSNHCGGNGFAIVDDEKALDMTYYNKYCGNHYISTRQLKELIERREFKIIVQEFKHGYDYSVSVLTVRGTVTHICGYVGYQMSCGAIINGKIAYNRKAYEIATKICKDLELDGNACFDFRLSPNGDVTLLEINPRVNASLPFVQKAGCNMLYLRCKNLLGDYSDVKEVDHIKYGLRMKKYYDAKYY